MSKFEVKIKNEEINGVVLSNQIRSLDWIKRDIEYNRLVRQPALNT
jgi:mRNA-degrading endonuclease toxin of MazEF toxin-antitoxin module